MCIMCIILQTRLGPIQGFVKIRVKVLSLAVSVDMAANIRFNNHWITQLRDNSDCYSSGDLSSGSTGCFTPMLFPDVLSTK